MSSLKTVQEEIEKALAASLSKRFNDGINAELDTAEFDERDLNKLLGNDAEAELYLRLFIRSKQGDLEKAYTTMIDSLKWRKKTQIRDLKLQEWSEQNSMVKEILEGEGILFYHNTDKENNAILIFQGNKYQYKKDDSREQVLETLFAYLLERQHQQRLGKQILVICDHQNATLEHIDLKFFKFVVNLFNIYYPSILYAFLVVDVSWRVSSAWRNIQKWLSPATSPKFKFVDKMQLAEYVDKSNLLVSLGGQDKYEYKYPKEEETQDPFEPLYIGYEPESLPDHSTFEDVKDHDGEARELSFPEMLPRENGSDMGGSMGTQLRKRLKTGEGAHFHYQTSTEEIPATDEEVQNGITISPPEEITFHQETANASEVQATFTIKNNCRNPIIFKIKTNSAANFRVKPSVGALEPGSRKEIVVVLMLKVEASLEKHHWNKNKFLVLYAEQEEAITNETNISEMWKHTPKSSNREYRLNCRVLDVNGLEMRPRTIDDAIEMNIKLQRQMSQLQEKMENFTDPLKNIQEQLSKQRLFLIVSSIVFAIFLFLLYYLR